MVRAILEGRKTQTRRVVNPRWLAVLGLNVPAQLVLYFPEKNPFGRCGDRLWVKETWRTRREWDLIPPRALPVGADEMHDPEWCAAQYITYATADGDVEKMHGKLRPSIFMRRWMSRITLEIVKVRVERLNAITEADAMAEGGMFFDGRPINHHGYRHDFENVYATARESYAVLWEKINGAGSWKQKPWVWMIEFKRI